MFPLIIANISRCAEDRRLLGAFVTQFHSLRSHFWELQRDAVVIA